MTTAGMSRLLLVASVLVFGISLPLLIAPDRTGDLFAWTIGVPLTAAFLGSAYLASGLAELACSREPIWANARPTVLPIFVFTVVTLIVTLVNRDAFHFGPEQPATSRSVAWLWLAIYAIVPLWLAWQLFTQVRGAGDDPRRAAPLVWWARASLAIHAAVLLAVGFVFLFAPAQTKAIWPWPLTILTAQAIAAWGLGLGLGALVGAWENDWRRLRSASPTYAAFGGLALANVARFRDTIDWASISAWILVVMLAWLLFAGVYAWLQGARAA